MPTELHLMLGTVNKIFDELNKIWGENRAHKFAEEQNIIGVKYFGGGMEGNQCVILMILQRLPLDDETGKVVYAENNVIKIQYVFNK